jgi:anti-sigma-K factor RskA
MICNEVEELGGAYALGALPAAELREVEEHLASCSKHPDLGELGVVARSLASAAPDAMPPSALKARIMDIVRRESGGEPETAARRGILDWLKELIPQRLTPAPAVAGVLAAIVVALLAWNVSSLQSDDGTIEREFSAVGAARGSLTYLRQQGLAVVSVENMQPLPANKTYQIWTIFDGTSTSVGFLDVSDSGRGASTIPVNLTDGHIVAVTVEPAGGSLQPTTPPVLEAEV